MSKLGYIQRYMLIIRLIRNNRYISLPELIRKVEDGLVYFDDTEELVKAGIKGTTYTDNLGSAEEMAVRYKLVAVNAAGESMTAAGRLPAVIYRGSAQWLYRN